jgi:hypothetical protein
MKLKEAIIKEIDEMSIEEMIFLYEQMKLIRKRISYPKSKYSIDEILELTATSKTNWSDDKKHEII